MFCLLSHLIFYGQMKVATFWHVLFRLSAWCGILFAEMITTVCLEQELTTCLLLVRLEEFTLKLSLLQMLAQQYNKVKTMPMERQTQFKIALVRFIVY